MKTVSGLCKLIKCLSVTSEKRKRRSAEMIDEWVTVANLSLSSQHACLLLLLLIIEN